MNKRERREALMEKRNSNRLYNQEVEKKKMQAMWDNIKGTIAQDAEITNMANKLGLK